MKTIITLCQADNIIKDRQQLFEGKRFYQPGVLAVYCVLANIPFAFFLYGINVHRRGDVRFGNLIKIMAAVTIVEMTIASAAGSNLFATRFLMPAIVIGLGIMKAESLDYEKAIAKGAKPARWWPPLLFIVMYLLIVMLLSYFTKIKNNA